MIDNYVDLAHTFLWTVFLLGIISSTVYMYTFKDISQKYISLKYIMKKMYLNRYIFKSDILKNISLYIYIYISLKDIFLKIYL